MAVELGGERLSRMRRLAGQLGRKPARIELDYRLAERPDSLFQLRLTLDEGQIRSGAENPTPWEQVRRAVIAGYGATRNLSSRIESGNEHLSTDVRRQITLFDPLSQLAGAEVLLEGQPSSLAFQILFQKLIELVFDADLRVTLASPISGINFTILSRDSVEAIDLPDGFRSAAAWLADLCSIWCDKAPDVAVNGNPADIHAIVLIDEIDLHLHPSLQRELIPRLRTALPKVQWIVTTHSPLVLANFDANEIIALDRDSEGGIRELDRQILGFTSDQIYDWLMGTRPMGAAIEEEFRRTDEGRGKSNEEIASLMRVSPTTDAETARRQVNEFKEILKSLKH